MDKNDPEYKRLHKLMTYERQARRNGFKLIAGVDEAGRGPLAGPVVAAVCILPKAHYIKNIDDSKKLSADTRSRIHFELVNNPKIRYGIGIADSEEIDRINIYQATIQAMLRAILQLDLEPDCLLVDGLQLPHSTIPVTKIIKGDQLSQSIAAASIIAKVTRDRMMHEFHEQYPVYKFNENKGYGTKFHREAILKHGQSPIHRKSFKLKDMKEELESEFEFIIS